ncbi:MAG: hypothetical protein ACTSUN_06400 [Promethearchaeota archaeon]
MEWDVEIAFLITLARLINSKGLLKDKKQKIFGVPNRLFLPLAWMGISVFIEILLNFAEILVWDW